MLDLPVRDNLDLDGKHTDAELWDALDRAQVSFRLIALTTHAQAG